MIEETFEAIPGVQLLLYAPHGAPDIKSMPVGTERPQMTTARALFVKLMKQYSELSYRLTLLEIQKLGYFMQEAGEPLRLKYEAHIYGPYAHNLNKLLELMEGHFTRGYGDTQAPDVEIELIPGALEEADRFLSNNVESREQLRRVAELIDGFETPYGMELLASVHWVAIYDQAPATSPEEAIQKIHDWSERKRKVFMPDHIRIAWARLAEKNWLH